MLECVHVITTEALLGMNDLSTTHLELDHSSSLGRLNLDLLEALANIRIHLQLC